jgi:hypothetical protein
MRPGFKGEPLAACDRCGFPMHLSELKKEWTNYMVCNKCWDPRHPQEFIRAIEDRQTVHNARHVQSSEEVTFITPTFPPDTTLL